MEPSAALQEKWGLDTLEDSGSAGETNVLVLVLFPVWNWYLIS